MPDPTFESLMEYMPVPDNLELTGYGRRILERLRSSITCVDPVLLLNQKRQERCIIPTCGKPLPPRRRRFCSEECGRWFTENHDWSMASRAAFRRNLETNFEMVVCYNHWSGKPYDARMPRCSRCKRRVLSEGEGDWRDKLDRRLEVDHIIPINGGYRAKSCLNHQDNLRVVCHRCHLEVTKEQRKAGLIGRKK